MRTSHPIQRKITKEEKEKLKLAQHSSRTHSYIDKIGRRTSRHLVSIVFFEFPNTTCMTVFDMARGQPERIMTSSDSPG